MSTNDRQSFVDGIYENPGDEGRRLIFADWLEEHGEPKNAAVLRMPGNLMLWRDGSLLWHRPEWELKTENLFQLGSVPAFNEDTWPCPHWYAYYAAVWRPHRLYGVVPSVTSPEAWLCKRCIEAQEGDLQGILALKRLSDKHANVRGS